MGDSPKLDKKKSNSASPPPKHKASVSTKHTQCGVKHCLLLSIFNLQGKARRQGDFSKYSPPGWLKQTSLRLSPYLPQVGDIVSLTEHAQKLCDIQLHYCSYTVLQPLKLIHAISVV